MANTQQHPYHLVDPSPLPLLSAISLFMLTFGGALKMHEHAIGLPLLVAGFVGILLCMFVWWRTVIREGIEHRAHTKEVRTGLRFGMVLFIASEVMFFVAFFWAYFSAGFYPKEPLADTWAIMAGVWPPKGIETADAWDIPLINTLILLLSGTTVTWAHHSLLSGDAKGLVRGLALTVLLGVIFTGFQVYEYHHMLFGFTDGIFASTFYLATGFHGLHVLIGTIFLFVCLVRAKRGTLTKEGHLGLEFAAWYWHFVDVVWLFLFVWVYWWGGA
jgi:cytochrome c oxidase subunit III